MYDRVLPYISMYMHPCTTVYVDHVSPCNYHPCVTTYYCVCPCIAMYYCVYTHILPYMLMYLTIIPQARLGPESIAIDSLRGNEGKEE